MFPICTEPGRRIVLETDSALGEAVEGQAAPDGRSIKLIAVDAKYISGPDPPGVENQCTGYNQSCSSTGTDPAAAKLFTVRRAGCPESPLAASE